MPDPLRWFLGHDDDSQQTAWDVARYSLLHHSSIPVDVVPLGMNIAPASSFYHRPTLIGDPGYWDVISEAPMVTGHAIARFLVPALCGYKGWAVFSDGDVLLRRDVLALLELADSRYAVHVVQQVQTVTEPTKIHGHIQTDYTRKNWSSLMLWNCQHPANRALTPEMVNTLPGRDLHRFCWLSDDRIGKLPRVWNYLVNQLPVETDPALVHFTDGLPDVRGYESSPYADEWFACRTQVVR